MDIASGNLAPIVFRRAITNDLGEFSLDGQMLSVLMQVDGQQTVGDIARKTGLNMGTMRKVISKLLQLKLIAVSEAAISVLDGDFFKFLKGQLSIAVGPIAEVLIEDAIADLGYNSNRFPSHQAAELVDLLSRNIKRDEKKITFKQNMVNKIREKGF